MRAYTLPTFAEIKVQDQQPTWSMSYLNARMNDIRERGFARLSVELVDRLAMICRDKRVVEVGAGLGLLSACLHDRGIDIAAYDLNNGLYANFGWLEPYFPLQEVDVTDLKQFDADIVILSWPCFDKSFAYDVATRMRKGQRLLYLGESRGGCTGNDDFFRQLATCRWRADEAASDSLNEFYQAYGGWSDRWQVLDCML